MVCRRSRITTFLRPKLNVALFTNYEGQFRNNVLIGAAA
jgi:hypothetical protein